MNSHFRQYNQFYWYNDGVHNWRSVIKINLLLVDKAHNSHKPSASATYVTVYDNYCFPVMERYTDLLKRDIKLVALDGTESANEQISENQ